MGINLKKSSNLLSRETSEKIIDLFESACMKNFVLSKQEELSIDDYVDIITSAPISIRKKYIFWKNFR